MRRAKRLGGPEHYGWGRGDEYLPVIGDLIQQNTSVTAAHGSKRRPRKVTPLPRPERTRTNIAKSLDDVDWDFFK